MIRGFASTVTTVDPVMPAGTGGIPSERLNWDGLNVAKNCAAEKKTSRKRERQDVDV